MVSRAVPKEKRTANSDVGYNHDHFGRGLIREVREIREVRVPAFFLEASPALTCELQGLFPASEASAGIFHPGRRGRPQRQRENAEYADFAEFADSPSKLKVERNCNRRGPRKLKERP